MELSKNHTNVALRCVSEVKAKIKSKTKTKTTEKRNMGKCTNTVITRLNAPGVYFKVGIGEGEVRWPNG